MPKALIAFSSLLGILFSTLQALAVEPSEIIGYAWLKQSLMITNATHTNYKPLKNGGNYPVLVQLKDGYSIVCEGVDGKKCAATLFLRDRFGNPLSIDVSDNELRVSSRFILSSTLDYVDLKPGVIRLETDIRYPVVKKADNRLELAFANSAVTQSVHIAMDTLIREATDSIRSWKNSGLIRKSRRFKLELRLTEGIEAFLAR